MSSETIQKKFLYDLGTVYNVEQVLLQSMQMMSEQTLNPSLGKLLGQHITDTQEQIAAFAEIYQAVGSAPESIPSDSAAGLVASAQKALQAVSGDENLRDCVIGEAILKAEHYEIASYRTLVRGAQQVGNAHALRLLQLILQQEESMAEIIEMNMQPIMERVALGEADIPLAVTAPMQSLNT